jgi:hypothetical protein
MRAIKINTIIEAYEITRGTHVSQQIMGNSF